MDIADIQLKQITEYNEMRLSRVKQTSVDHDFIPLRAVFIVKIIAHETLGLPSTGN